jgi:chromate reductase, NAD(P)H dehydrogenase (quinone)
LAISPRILAMAGSARKQSLNRKLLALAVTRATQAGASVTTVNLGDLRLPLYDGDLESERGIPTEVRALRNAISESDGLMMASPEHNGSVTVLLKNALDWCSRPLDGQDGLLPFRGKPVAMFAASPSPFGGIRGASHLRGILAKMGALPLADEVLVPIATKVFDEQGQLIDPMTEKLMAALCRNLVDLARKIAQPHPASA